MQLGMKRLYGLGRLKSGEMNKTEKAYAEFLELLKKQGKIQAYWFEAIKLQIAKNCSYTPDFLVLMDSGELQLHEVKGSLAIFRDDAKVKCKAVADKYPFRLVIAVPKKKSAGGGWSFLEY